MEPGLDAGRVTNAVTQAPPRAQRGGGPILAPFPHAARHPAGSASSRALTRACSTRFTGVAMPSRSPSRTT